MRLKYVVYESTLSTANAVPLPRWGRLRRNDASRRFFIKGRCPKVVFKSLAASHSSPISSPISLNRAIQSFASSFFTIWIAMPAWTRT